MAWGAPLSEIALLEIARGKVAGVASHRTFGRNTAVTTTEVVVTSSNAAYTGFLQAAVACRVKAGGDAADTAAGLGIREVTIVGLDQNWAEASEAVATAGASASAPTTTTFIRVFGAHASASGTYEDGVGSSLPGAAVTVETTSAIVMAVIPALQGESEIGATTIPAGKTGWLVKFDATVNGAKPATVELWERLNADDTSVPVSARRALDVFDALTGHADEVYSAYVRLPAKTDVWATAIVALTTTEVDVEFEIILVDD